MDQALELRRLVVQAQAAGDRIGNEPRILVVAGGKPGVGTTTLAVNLAITLAGDALRVVLVDANFARPEVAARCGLSDAVSLGDVLQGRKSIHEAIQRGPAGLQVVAGSRLADLCDNPHERTVQRLLRQVRSLGPHADWIVIDAGHEAHQAAAGLWSASEQVLLVTSPDAVAVMDTYSLIKTLLSRQHLSRPLALVVNMAANEDVAADVHRRIEQSSRRFLGLSLELVGSLPPETFAAVAARSGVPLALSKPDSPLITAVQRLAERVVQLPSPSSRRERLAA